MEERLAARSEAGTGAGITPTALAPMVEERQLRGGPPGLAAGTSARSAMRIRPRLAAAVLQLLCFVPLVSRAQSDNGSEPVLRNARQVLELARSRAHRLGTSAGPDPDTVYVGKSATNFTAPDNYWNIHTGTYLPGTGVATNALWDWDNSVGIQAPDSLHGWWPLRRQY